MNRRYPTATSIPTFGFRFNRLISTASTTPLKVSKHLHRNRCCAICGSHPSWVGRFASDFVEILGGDRAVLHIERTEIQILDWIPLASVKRLKDILVIGPVHSRVPLTNEAHGLQGAIIDTIEEGKIYILDGVSLNSLNQLSQRTLDGLCLALPGEKEDVQESKQSWKTFNTRYIDLNRRDLIVVHRQCWQILLGLNQLNFKEAITPEIFWHGVSHFLRSLSLAEFIPGGALLPATGFYPAFCEAPLKKDDDNYAQFKVKALAVAEYGGRRVEKDRAIEEELYERINIWAHYSLNIFPLDQICFQPFQDPPLIAAKGKEQGLTKEVEKPTCLSTLPVEIVQEIVSAADVQANVALSSTSKHMRNLIWDLMNRVAQVKVEKHDKWMMPMLPAEKGEWEAKIKQLTLKAQKKYKSKEIRFPWAAYHKRCLESTCWSMKKRHLVWQNASIILKSLHDRNLSA